MFVLTMVGHKVSSHFKAVMILVVIVFCLLVAYVVYFNVEQNSELRQHNQDIAQMRQKQDALNQEFQQEISSQEDKVRRKQQEFNQKDDDGDGLTFEEEERLGTNDNTADTDADGINDGEDAHPAGGGDVYKRTVNWHHNNRRYTTQFGIPEDLYLYYKAQPREYCCEGWDKFVTPDDITIKTIAKDIVDTSISTGDSCKYCIAIDFVQSMVYQYDIEYNGRNEYPKYAIETIIDEKGDCEDTSFLMASILEALNIDTVLFDLPGHMAVGVVCNGCTGSYYEYNGRKYFFLETTGSPGSWEIGRTGYDLNELEELIEV